MEQLGLVLSGGAARGAYTAGVLRFLFVELPRRLGRTPWPSIVTGTSVGALNGLFAAAHSPQAIDRLTRVWQQMQVEHVYRVESGGLVRTLRATWQAAAGAALLDASPLQALVRAQSPMTELRQAVDQGRCRAFIVSATQVDTGKNVLFVDTADPALSVDPMPGVRAVHGPLRIDHLLASAALPFVFKPIALDGAWYVDGGLRQNTPLRPALKAGADRVLVVGTTMEREETEEVRHPELTPNLPFLAGKTLNALLADPVERDLRNAVQLNTLIDWAVRRYGPDFARRLEIELGIRRVQTLFLRPSVDLGVMAAESWRSRPPKVPTQVRWILSTIADRANASDGESDLLSYLLFDRSFTAEAERIGFEDARNREEELSAFLSPTLMESAA